MDFCVGLDVGYSNLKQVSGELFGVNGRARQEWCRASGAGPAARQMGTLNGAAADPHAITVNVDGESYLAAASHDVLDCERTLDSEYPFTPGYKALFHAALVKTGQKTVDHLVTGLPVTQYLDAAYRARLSKHLTGHHEVVRGRRVEVKQVTVLPQPAGGYLDFCHGGSLSDDLMSSRVLVIDPGFFSVDWLLMDDQTIREGACGTSKLASSVALEAVERAIAKDHQDKLAGVTRLERAIRAGKQSLLVGGASVDLGKYMSRAMVDIGPQVISQIKRSLRREQVALDCVLLVGGGSLFYREVVEREFGAASVLVPENPVMANARGFWAFAHT